MRPSARIQAAIELVAAIEDATFGNGAATDDVVRGYFRPRRYAGSGDRRAIAALAYDAVRHRAKDIWRLEQTGVEAGPDLRIALRLWDRGTDWRPLFAGGEAHGPQALSPEETRALEQAPAFDIAQAPAWVRFGFPEFLSDAIETRFGDRLGPELTGLAQRAPLDLRVNTLKTVLRKAREHLLKEGISAGLMSWSPIGLRADAGTRITAVESYRQGWVEIQDEGSQLAAMLAAAKPGDQVLDLCAGAGGKTLALAAIMANRGQIYATDLHAARMHDLPGRLKRADARNVQSFGLGDDQGRRRLDALKGGMDVVLVDAPCSGSGTWRRDPTLAWRLTAEKIDTYAEIQSQLLDMAAAFPKPDGRITYVTCSILPQENEAVIEGFLKRHPSWRIVDYRAIWTWGDAPESLSTLEGTLQLSPASHGTDGFFVAVLCRSH